MKYRCCWFDNDPDTWTELEAPDWDDAANRYAEQLCERDNECYSSFQHGEIVLVKVAGSTPRAFEVTMEMLPHFSARPRL